MTSGHPVYVHDKAATIIFGTFCVTNRLTDPLTDRLTHRLNTRPIELLIAAKNSYIIKFL